MESLGWDHECLGACKGSETYSQVFPHLTGPLKPSPDEATCTCRTDSKIKSEDIPSVVTSIDIKTKAAVVISCPGEFVLPEYNSRRLGCSYAHISVIK